MKTVYYLIGNRSKWSPVKVGGRMTEAEATEVMKELKREGKMAFSYKEGNVIKSSDEFSNDYSKEKYWADLMARYFENN